MCPWDCFLYPQSLLKIFLKQIILIICLFQGNYSSLVAQLVTCNTGDLGSIPGLGRSPGEGNGYPLQYSGLENSMDCGPPGSFVHGDSLGKNTGVGCHAILQGIFPTMEPRSPALQVDSLPSEPPRKPRNTGMGTLTLLQGIFPTQESN